MASNDMMAVIKEAAAAAYPNEACGLIVRRGAKSVTVVCSNVSETPKTHFVMDVRDYAKAADQGEVIGVWHTHVEQSNKASDADLAGVENSELPWYIVSVFKAGDEFIFEGPNVVEPSGHETPYLERPYAFGVLDCWSLVRDYYRREFGIKLGDYPRIEYFWQHGFNFFGENWKKEGFVKMIDAEPKVGDLFIIQTAPENPNHIAVYVGEEQILHHCHGRLSKRDIYGGYWLKHTVLHLRHESKC